MAYDYADGYVVLFGGSTMSQVYLNQTWIFSGGHWRELHPHVSPPGRDLIQGQVLWDGADQYVLLFGGRGNTSLTDTWSFKGGNWTEICSSCAPEIQQSAAAYDAKDGYVVTAAGQNEFPLYNDTNASYKYVGGVWTKLVTPHFLPRQTMAAAYDSRDGMVIAYGGSIYSSIPADCFGLSPYCRDTWTFMDGVWTELCSGGAAAPTCSPTPPASTAGLMDFDPNTGSVLMYGGYNLSATSETYTFLTGAWTLRSPTTVPPAFYGAPMVYDANSRDQMSFTFGGDGQNDSWLWRTNDWGAVQFIQGQVMNATTGSPIAGANVTDGIRWAITDATGEYNLTEPSGSYILTATAPGYYAGSASVTVSSDNPGQNFDLVPTLTAVASASPTSGRAPLKVTFTGSVRGGVAPCTYSWRYGDGGKSSDLSPTHTYNASGNYTAKFWVNDSASHSVGSMVAVTVTAPIPRPNITSFTVSPASVVVGGNVTFSVSVTGGMLPLNYSYSNLPTGCKSSNTTHLLCSPTGAGKFRTVVTVTDSERRTVNASATLNVTVPIGPPTITSFAASPASIVLGDSTTLTVEATGGTTPYSISYFDLPPGCLSSNTSELTCIPSAAGVYAIGVYVNDTSGHSVTSATTLTVHPTGWGSGPTITGFSASPSAEDVVGTTVMMTVQASGGTGALTYRYTGLPPGCSSTNSSTLSCSLPEVGNYTVRVYVNDSDGHSASTTLTLTATPPLATTLLANRTQLYAGGSIELSEFTTGGVAPYALSWSMNGTNTTYAGTSWALTLAHSGNYTFAVWAKDAHGNVAASQRVKVQVLPAPPGKVTTVVSQSQPYPWWWLLVLLVFGVVAVLIVVILLVRRRHTDRNGSAKVSVAVATADASLAPPNAPKVHTEAPAVVPAERVEGAEEPALGAHPASVASALAASEPVSAQREALAPSPQLSKGTHVQFEGTIGQERTEESPFEGDIKPEEVNPNVQHLDPKLLQPMEMRITQDRGSDVRETEPEKDSDTRAKELLERAQRSRSKRKSKFGVEQAPKPEKSDEK